MSALGAMESIKCNVFVKSSRMYQLQIWSTSSVQEEVFAAITKSAFAARIQLF